MTKKTTSAPNRFLSLGAGMAAGAIFILLASFAVPADSIFANVLFDRNGRFPYPFTIQNVIWIIFFIGLGELFLRFGRANAETRQLSRQLLPEDDETMLRAEDLGVFSAKARASGDDYFLQTLISRVIFQFQSGRSVAQANDIMNSSLELHQHELGFRYNILRYIAWLIPTLGFVGTVIGIAMALSTAGSPPDVTDPGALKPWMKALTSDLGVAFNTTLVALTLSAIIVFLMHIAEEKEELALNKAGQYCLDNLINRLYEK